MQDPAVVHRRVSDPEGAAGRRVGLVQENAVTHDVTASLLRPVARGSDVLVAAGQVTKTVVTRA